MTLMRADSHGRKSQNVPIFLNVTTCEDLEKIKAHFLGQIGSRYSFQITVAIMAKG